MNDHDFRQRIAELEHQLALVRAIKTELERINAEQRQMLETLKERVRQLETK